MATMDRTTHIIDLSLLELGMKSIGFRYELINKSELLGIRVPFTYKPSINKMEFGINPKLYFFHSKNSKYKFGNIQLGNARFDFYAGPSVLYQKLKNAPDDDAAIRLHLTPGFAFQIASGLRISAEFGAGIMGYTKDDGAAASFSGTQVFDYKADICIGWRL